MKRMAFCFTVLFVLFISTSALADGCITQKRGVRVRWFKKSGCSLKLSKVRKMTKTFRVTVDIDRKGNTIYSGIPYTGQKIPIPAGTYEVILNIAQGQGELCYVSHVR